MITVLNAIIYGIVQGLTEYLPISSNAHLRLTQILLDPKVDNGAFTAFTAVIQLGTIAALFVYFWSDLKKAFGAWAKSLVGKLDRNDPDARMGWAVFWGTIPIVILGIALKHHIEHTFRSLTFIGVSLIAMGVLMAIAERVSKRSRGFDSVTVGDGVKVGLFQCLALIPGMSRSGSTITGGLFIGFDRVTAARFSFLLGIPSITLAGFKEMYEFRNDIMGGQLMTPTIIATIVSFIVGYAAITFLMNFLQKRGVGPFVIYRVVLGALVLGCVFTGKVDPNAGEEPAKPEATVTAMR